MEQLQTIKVALLGFGTVGGGVFELLEKRKEEMPDKIGVEVEIKKILLRDKSKKRLGIEQEVFTDSWNEIIEDEEIQVVIEVMGGIEPARSYILEALCAGKHVVTANKDLLAEHGKELLDTAAKYGCDLMFEAAVAGGIPIIRPMKQCLAGNDISEIMGIVNGTTNFILTKMSEEGMSYQEALKKAKELGYAEADPTADVEGYDAGRKIAIMASIAFHSRVTFFDVYIEGITKITEKDIAYAKELGMRIKLLGVAKHIEEGIEVKVHPMLLSKEHPLANVADSFNAVFVHGDALDDAMFMGRGAGALPTASAVVGDLIDVVRNMKFHCNGRIGCSCYKEVPVKKIEETSSKFFMRLQVKDKPGALAGVANVLGNSGVSIAQVVQKAGDGSFAELVVITDVVQEGSFQDAITILGGMSMVKEISSVVRVYA